MPVVINEFEVVPASAEPQPSAPASDRPAAGPAPHDIERLLERAIERVRRVHAH